MTLRLFLFFSIIVFLFSCSKDKEVYKPSEKKNPYEIYSEGLEAFKKNEFFFANKKFTEAELNFDKPELAAKSAIMASYSLYGINFYNEAEENLERFIKTYPVDKNVIYAHYLLSIIFYEQISDEKKDLQPLLKAQDKINFFLNSYPNTEYATDLRFKNDLIQNQLAAKELYVAKYYISVKKWIPALNRLKIIVEKYDKTVFIEEALHRLVEIYFILGLEQESEKYAKLLGYNYKSSQWYENSYKVFNKSYKKKKLYKEKKSSILTKAKSLFN